MFEDVVVDMGELSRLFLTRDEGDHIPRSLRVGPDGREMTTPAYRELRHLLHALGDRSHLPAEARRVAGNAGTARQRARRSMEGRQE